MIVRFSDGSGLISLIFQGIPLAAFIGEPLILSHYHNEKGDAR